MQAGNNGAVVLDILRHQVTNIAKRVAVLVASVR